MNSLKYKASPIPSGGLEVPLSLKFKCDEKWVLDAMEEFVDNFYSYDFAGNLINDEDEDDESVDFDTVVIEEGEKFKDSSSDDEHEGESDSGETEMDLSGEITVVVVKYTLYTLFLTLGENFRRGKVTSDEMFYKQRKFSPTKFSPIR